MAKNQTIKELHNQEPKAVIGILNEIDELYSNSPDQRTKVLRSGENVYLTAMILANILFAIEEKTRGIVELSATFRVKSQESQNEKVGSKGKKDIKDVIAGTIVIDRIHNSKDFARLFFKSPNLISRYYERSMNIQIMKIIINYIETIVDKKELPVFADDGISLRKLTEEEKSRIKNQCNVIKINIRKYEQDEPEAKEDAKLEELPTDQYILDICKKLRINRIKDKKDPLKKAIEDLEAEIEDLKAEIAKISQEEQTEKKEQLTKYKNAMQNIERIEKEEPGSEEPESLNQIEAELAKLPKDEGSSTYQKIDDLPLYKKIIEHLEKKLQKKGKTNIDSDEKLVCKLNLIVINSLMELQFKKNGKFQGDKINQLEAQLHTALQSYYEREVNNNNYAKLQFSEIQTLLSHVAVLNASLSDKLQWDFIEYMMNNYGILDMVKSALGVTNCKIDIKSKANEYLGQHYDFPIFELKITTDYRYRVQTHGTAAYAGGRSGYEGRKKINKIKELVLSKKFSDISNAKKYHVTHVKQYYIKDEKIYYVKSEDADVNKLLTEPPKGAIKRAKEYRRKYKETFQNFPYKKIIDETDEISYNGSELIYSSRIQAFIDIWRNRIFKSIPRYFEVKYEDKKVQITVCSEAENISMLFNNTNLLSAQREVGKTVDMFVKWRIYFK